MNGGKNAKKSGWIIILIIYSGFDLCKEFRYNYTAKMNSIFYVPKEKGYRFIFSIILEVHS